jgi:hypothetical protein
MSNRYVVEAPWYGDDVEVFRVIDTSEDLRTIVDYFDNEAEATELALNLNREGEHDYAI